MASESRQVVSGVQRFHRRILEELARVKGNCFVWFAPFLLSLLKRCVGHFLFCLYQSAKYWCRARWGGILGSTATKKMMGACYDFFSILRCRDKRKVVSLSEQFFFVTAAPVCVCICVHLPGRGGRGKSLPFPNKRSFDSCQLRAFCSAPG